jgi:hypothetical protein
MNFDEQLVSLSDAAKLVPARRGGKRPHVSCIYRWTKVGCKGVVLESIQCGGTRCTSKEALIRFFLRLSGKSPAPAESSSAHKRRREREIRSDEDVLDRAGIR